MKRYLILAVVVTAFACLSSCASEADDGISVVDVAVQDAHGILLENAEVHLFVDSRPTRFASPDDARVSRVTDGSGVASFDLDLRRMKISPAANQFYFSVYYEVDERRYVATEKALYLQNGGEEYITVTLPILLM